MRHDRRLHARATHLVDGGGLGGFCHAGAKRGLARRRLTKSSREHAAHDRLIDRVWRRVRGRP